MSTKNYRSAETPMTNTSPENYRNLVYGNINPPGWQTPGYPTSQSYQPHINMANFIESASADVDEAQLQNSPFSPLPAIGCSHGHLGAARCNNGTFQGNEALSQQATAFQQGTVLAFTENFAGCGKAAEGKLANLDAISDQLYIKRSKFKKNNYK